MKFSESLARQVSSRLVVRANELYHNAEGGRYDERQHGWLTEESRFFGEFAAPHFAAGTPRSVLDYGSGTGFVPLAIRHLLRAHDSLACLDLSQEMLDVCRAKLDAAGMPCAVRYLKSDGLTIPQPDDSVDVMTVNAVLHHFHDLAPFARECHRVLRAGGVLLVAHEPNGDRRLPASGRLFSGLASAVLRPRSLVDALVERIPALERALRAVLGRFSPAWRQRNAMLAGIARTLREENLIDRELRGVEIQQLVDFQTQGGFSSDLLFAEAFRGLVVERRLTYNHFGSLNGERGAAGLVARIMARCWPDAGCSLAFVLRKVAPPPAAAPARPS